MKTRMVQMAAAMAVAGIAVGYAARRVVSGPGADGTEHASASGISVEGRLDGKSRDRAGDSGFRPSTLRSADSAEALLELPDDALYGRLALWLMDADEGEIAALWEKYGARENRSNDIVDVIFINWARLNPQGAIAAVAGTSSEHHAWWAWSCHDPDAALALALATSPERVKNVAWGIGEFHPKRARELFEEIPEEARSNVLAGMSKWHDGENPQERLDFLKANGRETDEGTLKLLVRQDPWAAYEWVRKNAGDAGGGKDPMDSLVAALAEEHPEALVALAKQAPSGELRRKMEAAVFKGLLDTDPEAALEQARGTESPVVAAERWAALGNHWLQSDPERAFGIVEEMFGSKTDMSVSTARTIIEVDGVRTIIEGDGILPTFYSVGLVAGVSGLLEGLAIQDPGRLLGLIGESSDDMRSSDMAAMVTRTWADRDLDGVSGWAAGQPDSPVRNSAIDAVSIGLVNGGRFTEAMEWARTYPSATDAGFEAQPNSRLSHSFHEWVRNDPEQARIWLEAAVLPEVDRANLEQRAAPWK